MTSVPPPTFGPKGFIAPSEADILAGVQADINAAFGGGSALQRMLGGNMSDLIAVRRHVDSVQYL